MKVVFEDIYKNKTWKYMSGTESGPGSSIEYSSEYLNFLTEFVTANNIKTILDAGCGDFQLMKHFDLTNIDYLGIDIVDGVIKNNIIHYKSDNINFVCGDIIDTEVELNFDLVLVKDVLQHFDYENIHKFLYRIKSAKMCLITNDFENKPNENITTGSHRHLDLSKEPFNICGKYVFGWKSHPYYKKSFLICHT